MNLTSAAWSTLGWLTAYPALVRELIAADAVVREDGAVSVGPGALRARGWKLMPHEKWPRFVAVCTEFSADHCDGAMTLNLEINGDEARGGVLRGDGTIGGKVIRAGDTIEVTLPEVECRLDVAASVIASVNPFPFDRDEMMRRIREHQAALPDLSHLTVIVPAAHLAMVAGWFPQNDPKQPRVETWRGCVDSVFVLDRSKAGVSPSGVFSDAKSTPWSEFMHTLYGRTLPAEETESARIAREREFLDLLDRNT